MAAVSGGMICAIAALVVDLGSVALTARQLQGVADLAALSAARDLAHADAAARATVVANLGPGPAATVLTGRYQADKSLAPNQRFKADAVPNAVRVTISDAAPLYFGRWILGRDTLDLRRSATAAADDPPPRALFSIGSRLAALDGGIANQMLSAMTGSTVSLNVMDYRSLADARINLLSFSNALATRLHLQAGDYDTLLASTVDAGDALGMIETVAGPSSSSALSRLGQASAGMKVRIGDLIGADAGAGRSLTQGLDTSVSVLDLATALLQTGTGSRQIEVATAAQVGIADLKVSLAIGERPNHSPWLTVTKEGTPIIRTAQTRLYIRARTAQKLSGLAQVNLPILIELAPSEARLDAIRCAPARKVTLGVRPGVAKATIGTIDEALLGDFTKALTPVPATLMSVIGVVSVTGSAVVDASDVGFTPTDFTDAQITAQEARTVTSAGFVNGIVVSLLQRMQIDVRVLGLGLGLGGLVQATGVLLAPLGPVLDGVVDPTLKTLGLRFGQADVTVLGATCPMPGTRAVLVG